MLLDIGHFFQEKIRHNVCGPSNFEHGGLCLHDFDNNFRTWSSLPSQLYDGKS